MKRFTIAVVALMLSAFTMQALAHDEHGEHKMDAKAAGMEMKSDSKSMDKMESKSMTITGEVVDTGCYLSHGAHGADHASCATKCISGGMPMALLTNDGALYLITMNHDNPDAYNKLKEMAAKTVSVTGTTMERNGMKAIDAVSFKPAEMMAKPASK